MPLPLPLDYVQGIDRQMLDFEFKPNSYLNGRWQEGGWYYYYVEGLFVKSPLALLPLLLIAGWRYRKLAGSQKRLFSFVMIPGIVILSLVSLKTGFNRHFRYALPALPFLFIVASMAASRLDPRNRVVHPRLWIVTLLVSFFCIESAWCLPHSVSFFNLAVGGPANGHHILGHTNVDWGQDLLRYECWRTNTASPPLAGASLVIGTMFLNAPMVPGLPKYASQLQPGFYALSVRRLIEEGEVYEFFRSLKPVDSIGYSILVFHVRKEDVNRLVLKARQN